MGRVVSRVAHRAVQIGAIRSHPLVQDCHLYQVRSASRGELVAIGVAQGTSGGKCRFTTAHQAPFVLFELRTSALVRWRDFLQVAVSETPLRQRLNSQLFARGRFRYSTKACSPESLPLVGHSTAIRSIASSSGRAASTGSRCCRPGSRLLPATRSSIIGCAASYSLLTAAIGSIFVARRAGR
jgi:hypothetical protein